tara:strand:+ start:2716 stop:3843 length:1128 start_codon:yes stop_codon:yes gene_type:complete
MKFKSVKTVDSVEKSTQEIEQELVSKHEEEQGIKQEEEVLKVSLKEEEPVIEEKSQENEEVVEEKPIELDDEIVLSHIRKKFGKEELSYDDLLQKEVVEKELSEDLEALRKYKQETGRGIEDFVKLNRSFNDESPDAIISEYISTQNPEFDRDDVSFEMEQKFSFDDEIDEEVEIRRKKIAKKKMLAEATRFFNDEKEKYKAPLESRDGFISDEDKDLFEKYKQSAKQENESKDNALKRSEHFSAKTNDLFSKNFEGFGYEVGEEKITLKVSDVDSVKNTQSDAMNFINKHLDDDGMLKDANAYHKALNAAMDPDALFKFAYEKGAADAITKDVKEAKNVDMKAKTTGQNVSTEKKYRVVNPDSGNRLVIKSKNK